MTDSDTPAEYGDRQAALAGEILRTLVGSEVHGLALPGAADRDEMGIYVESPATVLGIGPPAEHYVARTRPEGVRSAPGDTDLVSYSLRKYLRLAAKGNPTVLLPLFAPDWAVLVSTPLGVGLRALAPALLSQESVRRFLGYLDAQHRRLLGEDRRHVPHRPELVARFGYDVKYASHALRLAYQGLELVEQARLTLPMPEPERERVLAVKSGRVPELAAVLAEIADVRARVADRLASGATPLPVGPDLDRITEWSVQAHRRHWADNFPPAGAQPGAGWLAGPAQGGHSLPS